ncbi:magnesium transporter, partial [Streptomyces sp. NPDC057757]
MAGPGSRVFISHLSAVAVFDPNGDQVGRVRDVVVSLRLGGRPPLVLGLVVEVVARRRIFLPMTRVTSLESGQVLTTGLINLRRFEQRPSETLVLAELLDRTVTWSKTAEDVTVLDVGMVQTRLREWEVSKVFVQVGRATRLRKGKGERLTLDWQDVTGFALPEQDQGAANLLATFEQLRPADLASVMHHLSA